VGTPLSSGSYTATAFARHLSAPEPFPNPRRPSPSFGREYDRPGPLTSHLDPRTRASVLPPRKDPIGGASTLEEARESYRAKLAALLGAGRHEMPSVIEHLRAQR
jgi:hypothetical protein